MDPTNATDTVQMLKLFDHLELYKHVLCIVEVFVQLKAFIMKQAGLIALLVMWARCYN